MPNIVFIQGPPKSGKDTIVKNLIPYLNFQHLKFAQPLRDIVKVLFDCDDKWLEENKDAKQRILRRADTDIGEFDRIRDLMISLSEDFFKPRYGEGFFGNIIVNRIHASSKQLILLSDSGFPTEAIPVISIFRPHRCLIIQLHRAGCTFESDSRSYWSHAQIPLVSIENNMTIHDLTMQALHAIIKRFDVKLLREPSWIK